METWIIKTKAKTGPRRIATETFVVAAETAAQASNLALFNAYPSADISEIVRVPADSCRRTHVG